MDKPLKPRHAMRLKALAAATARHPIQVRRQYLSLKHIHSPTLPTRAVPLTDVPPSFPSIHTSQEPSPVDFGFPHIAMSSST
ncbi:uncharacterized protein ANIA_11134 [Aspergillus nidulans FGSC A4]|uniref:Uncharacterized protein n=1 Tax=Emericella nidulans (strain FGSC A4 / ATCC 38163 / CBS 112.46 / NRRL 194 / M139) TaxID=227321 RepID=C8V9H7_EMENI|nr:hypothetical protein [Aspergillus nidulans FGSC A4]CBF77880.1 TPA: conserved hypothetical protein [Aspergillus nidulans FGSC A4]